MATRHLTLAVYFMSTRSDCTPETFSSSEERDRVHLKALARGLEE